MELLAQPLKAVIATRDKIFGVLVSVFILQINRCLALINFDKNIS